MLALFFYTKKYIILQIREKLIKIENILQDKNK